MKLTKYESELLKAIYDDYVETLGRDFGSFRQFSIELDIHSLNHTENRIRLYDEYLRNGFEHYEYSELCEKSHANLCRYGLLKNVSVIGTTRYNFTLEGIEQAELKWWEKALKFANANNGLTIIIALLALIVSILALFKN